MGKICCFAGHEDIGNVDELYNKVSECVEELIIREGIKDFLIGDFGDFDEISKKAVLDISLRLVTPYSSKIQCMGEYEEILTVDIPKNAPTKFSYIKCNEYMIDRSDYMICYIWEKWRGVAKTLEYAKEKNIKIYNLA